MRYQATPSLATNKLTRCGYVFSLVGTALRAVRWISLCPPLCRSLLNTPTRTRLASTKWRTKCREKRGFTLAEVLAALMFMAIVIPVAVQGLRIASLSGEVAHRKAAAGRLADRLLNETIVTAQWQQSSQAGTVQEGPYQYRWQLYNEPWTQDALRVLSMQVTFAVQGQDYDVRLSTLVDDSQSTQSQQQSTSTSSAAKK